MDIKTITSTEGVNEVDFGSSASRFYWFQNIGTTTVHVSGKADITAGSDGVAELAAGGVACIETLGGKVYVLGAGKVQIHNTGDKFCPVFKKAPAQSGGEAVDAYSKTESDARYPLIANTVPRGLGFGYGTCATAAATAAKTATISGTNTPKFVNQNGGIISIKFTNAVPAKSTLNVNNGGAKAIFYHDKNIVDGIISAGDTATFIMISNVYHVIAVENGHTVKADVPADAKFTDTVIDASLFADKAFYGDTTINVGRKAGSTVGLHSTAEGKDTIASGNHSHAEGYHTTANGTASHAEGYCANAGGYYSHAEGDNTVASGAASHAEGSSTTASGDWSHTEGKGTTASKAAEHASGQYNVSNEDTLFSVGDGTGDNNRHNAFEITKIGGKLHDRNIGISFTNAEAMAIRIEIPDSVDVAQWLVQNAKSGIQYCISTKGSRTNLPNVSADWMWFSYDANRYLARAWAGGTHTADFVLDAVNSVGGWKEISYTPIKSTPFSGTTNEYGNVVFTAVGNKIPVFAECSPYCGIPLRFNDNYWIHCINPITANNSIVANTAVTGTVYYVEI